MMRLPALLLAGALAALATAAAADPIRLCTEGAYAPYNYMDEAGRPAGFDIDVGNAVCRQAQLDCTWVSNDWDTIIPNLQSDNYDAILAAMTITSERRQLIDFTQSYMPPDPSTFLAPADSKVNFDNLQAVRIGVQRNTPQSAYADANFADGNTIVGFDSIDDALDDLRSGKVDVLLADGGYVAETAAGSDGKLVAAGPLLPIGEGVGIGVRKGDDKLKDQFDAALTALKQDGTLEDLIRKWFPERGGGPFFGG
jgi:polar amino acid transport system substrate-binding protein